MNKPRPNTNDRWQNDLRKFKCHSALSHIPRVSETRRTCGRLDRCLNPDRAQRGDAPFLQSGRLMAGPENV